MTAPAVVRRWEQRPPVPAGRPTKNGAPVAPRRSEASSRLAVRDRLAVMRRAAPMGVVLLTALAAHAGLAQHLAVRRFEPDVLLVAVVAVAAGRGPRPGAAFGFAAGLGADLFLATPLGTSALAYTLVGHLMGRSRRPRPAISAAAVTGAAVAAGRCGTAMVATALAGIPFLRTAGLLHILGVAVVSAPLGIPALAAGRRFGRGRGDRR